MKQPQIKGIFEYSYNNKVTRLPFGIHTEVTGPGLTLTSYTEEHENGSTFRMHITSESEIIIKNLYFKTDLLSSKNDRVFLNGYQSWTDTKEFDRHDRIKAPSKLFSPLTEKYKVTRYADYEFQKYSGKPGDLHGASYGYIRSTGEKVTFFGSLDEKTGFTFFYTNLRNKTMIVKKDCRDLHVTGTYQPFNILFCEGTVDAVMDEYFATMKIKARPARPCTGWTSWYNYYQNISEQIILDNLEAFKQEKLPIDIFQIDDGYQTAVGDWLSINDRFPNGMKPIADKIKAAGYTPGIWLAPFAGETISKLFKEHEDWFITDEDGKPFSTGGNWSAFYSLDIYNKDARAYIQHVFDVVLNEWGFELVKLDFLYGACIKPRKDKTRGQIMSDAMDFIRECVGDKKILGCGVPLWSAFGKVEFCRIGTDIDLQWHNKFYGNILHREFPSTKYALQNSAFRQHLDGRAFVNDPDVFLLRHTNITLSAEQKRTVFYINNVFGNLLFTSDNIKEYTDEERKLYLSSFPLSEKKISSFNFDKELYTASFSIGKNEYYFVSNHSEKPRTVTLSNDMYFRAGSETGNKGRWVAPLSELIIEPFSAECFLKCTPDIPWTIAGTTLSAFPGSEISTISVDGNKLSVALLNNIPSKGVIYITIPEKTTDIVLGETKLPVSFTSVKGKKIYYAEVQSRLL